MQASPEDSRLIKMARLVNDSKPSFVLNKVLEAVSNTGKILLN